MVSRTLIVVTRNRLHYLVPRAPLWRAALEREDFSEIFVVDSSNRKIAPEVARLCRDMGFLYVFNPRSQWRDSRVSSFNLGARKARGEWILYTSDKMDVAGPMDHAEFDRLAADSDFMMAPDSQTTRIFRRSFFLELGGYDPRFIHCEDVKITEIARQSGRLGNCQDIWFMRNVVPIEDVRDPIDLHNRVWNHFRYGMSILSTAFLVRRDRAWTGRTLLSEMLGTLKEGRRFGISALFALSRMLGWAFAIPYFVYVQSKFGEPRPLASDWSP